MVRFSSSIIHYCLDVHPDHLLTALKHNLLRQCLQQDATAAAPAHNCYMPNNTGTDALTSEAYQCSVGLAQLLYQGTYSLQVPHMSLIG